MIRESLEWRDSEEGGKQRGFWEYRGGRNLVWGGGGQVGQRRLEEMIYELIWVLKREYISEGKEVIRRIVFWLEWIL